MIRSGSILLSIFLVVACASGPRVTKTFEASDVDGTVLRKVLVVVVGNDYTRRAEFERAVASRLNERGTSAIAYYTVVPGNDSLTRDVITDTIDAGQFDSLLLTRIVSQDTHANLSSGPSTLTATRREDVPFDFFRYDYEELTDPDVISVTREGTLLTELYSARDERMVWAIETTVSGEMYVSAAVDQIADAIANQLDHDGLVGQ